MRQTAHDLSEMSQLLASGASSPEQQMMARERAQMVSAALKYLSPNQRTIFMLRFIEEMDLSEICETTGMQISTVKTHLHRAVKAVRAAGREAVMSERMSAMGLRNHNPHLTEEQFAKLLMGATSAAEQEHLKACPECVAEAERVSGAIGCRDQRQSRVPACSLGLRGSAGGTTAAM